MSTTAEILTINWPGNSGKQYKYWIYKLSRNFAKEPGNYIFAIETEPGLWVPVYIGQTEDLSERFEDHHKAACISRNGATHIHANTNNSKQARLAEESDLVARWNPPCNG